MFSVKDYVYIFVIIAMISSAWYSLSSWHYKPIKQLTNQVNILKQESDSKDITINNLGVEIVQLTKKNKIAGFEGYFDGLSEINISTSDRLIF